MHAQTALGSTGFVSLRTCQSQHAGKESSHYSNFPQQTVLEQLSSFAAVKVTDHTLRHKFNSYLSVWSFMLRALIP